MVKTICLCDRCGNRVDYPVSVMFQSAEPGGSPETAGIDLCEGCDPIVYSFAAEALIKEAPPVQPEEARSQLNQMGGGGTKKRTRVDIGKIKALRDAGWSVKEIAAEMKLKTSQVSNALYLAKKKQEEAENE